MTERRFPPPWFVKEQKACCPVARGSVYEMRAVGAAFGSGAHCAVAAVSGAARPPTTGGLATLKQSRDYLKVSGLLKSPTNCRLSNNRGLHARGR